MPRTGSGNLGLIIRVFSHDQRCRVVGTRIGQVIVEDAFDSKAIANLHRQRRVVNMPLPDAQHILGDSQMPGVMQIAGQHPARDLAAQVKPPRQCMPRLIQPPPDAQPSVIGMNAQICAVEPLALRIMVGQPTIADGFYEFMLDVGEVKIGTEGAGRPDEFLSFSLAPQCD